MFLLSFRRNERERDIPEDQDSLIIESEHCWIGFEVGRYCVVTVDTDDYKYPTSMWNFS